MGGRGEVRAGVPAAVALVLCSAMAAACTTPGRAGRAPPPRPSAPAASALHSNPSSLVDRPVASTGCGRQAGIRPGTTAQLTVAVPPASAAGAGRRSYWLHVPRNYSASHLMPLVLALHGGAGTALGMERTSGLS